MVLDSDQSYKQAPTNCQLTFFLFCTFPTWPVSLSRVPRPFYKLTRNPNISAQRLSILKKTLFTLMPCPLWRRCLTYALIKLRLAYR
jgi:hypothetical protein